MDLIARYIDTQGYRPSYQVIARHLGLRSRAGIARIVQDLESLGLLERHRDDGHFNIEMKGRTAGVLVSWLEVPGDLDAGEDWRREPLQLPEFMLGGYERSSMRLFAVRDNAMSSNGIFDGDIALVEVREFSRPGQIVVAVVNDERTVLRTFNRIGGEIELGSGVDGGETIKVAANRVVIIGVQRGILRPAI